MKVKRKEAKTLPTGGFGVVIEDSREARDMIAASGDMYLALKSVLMYASLPENVHKQVVAALDCAEGRS